MKLSNVLPGDIFGFSGNYSDSALINLVTYGCPWYSVSHVGIMAEVGNDLLLFESTTGPPGPCFVQKRIVHGTQAQKLDFKIDNYWGKIYHYRLKKPLRKFERQALTRFLLHTLGVAYDTVGAFRSGGLAWSWFESKLRKESRAALFCSEWVAAALRNIERFDTDNYSKWSPNALMRELGTRDIVLAPERIK